MLKSCVVVDAVACELRTVCATSVDTGQGLHIEARHCAVPYSQRSRLLILHVICAFLNRATPSKNIVWFGLRTVRAVTHVPLRCLLALRRVLRPPESRAT